MNDTKEMVVFPPAAQTPEAIRLLDDYEKNATIALEKLTASITDTEARLKSLVNTHLVVAGQRELIFDMKKKLLAATPTDTSPAVPATDSATTASDSDNK